MQRFASPIFNDDFNRGRMRVVNIYERTYFLLLDHIANLQTVGDIRSSAPTEYVSYAIREAILNDIVQYSELVELGPDCIGWSVKVEGPELAETITDPEVA